MSIADARYALWSERLVKLQQQIPALHVEGDGEIVSLGPRSAGCQACQQGTWDCIFVTTRCNLNCAFCCSPQQVPRDYTGSAFGATPEAIARNHLRTEITGISFSGGEPFIDPQSLFEWVAFFTTRFPGKYIWVYTNGLLALPEHLVTLAELGVKEIRFNLAATGYDHPTVLRNLVAAIQMIPNVTVEIPVIPRHGPKLIECLETWSALGVKYLNLHELLYEPGTNSARMTGSRCAVVLADGHRVEFDPESRDITLTIIEDVHRRRLPLFVNDCSLQCKIRQLRGRRRSLAPITRASHEKLVEDLVLESYHAWDAQGRSFACHPDILEEMQRKHPDCRFQKVQRLAPLSVRELRFLPQEDGALSG